MTAEPHDAKAQGRELLRPDVKGVFDTKPLGFAPIVVAKGGALVITGSVGYDEDWRLTGDGGLEAQMRQAARNLILQFATAGVAREDIIHVRINNVDLQPDDRFVVARVFDDEIYSPSKEHRPATSLIGIAALARPDLKVELEAMGLAPA